MRGGAFAPIFGDGSVATWGCVRSPWQRIGCDLGDFPRTVLREGSGVTWGWSDRLEDVALPRSCRRGPLATSLVGDEFYQSLEGVTSQRRR